MNNPLQDAIRKILSVFPEEVTETQKMGEDGKPYTVYALKREFADVLSGRGLDFVGDDNRYELQFPGKRMARAQAFSPSFKTLAPDHAQSQNFADTRNVFIGGDNLDALRLLRANYRGRIKMIYIDPPYNTGNDGFVYNDNFSVKQMEYLRAIGAVDEDGARQVDALQNGLRGRFHLGWLAFMYPRLKLARELLADDGVIFISIDDNEMANLTLMCNEIFGEENQLGPLVLQTNPRGRHLDMHIAKTFEYMLVYSANAELCRINQVLKDDQMMKAYKFSDENGRYRLIELRHGASASFNRRTRPNMFFPIYADPSSGKVSLEQDQTYSVECLPMNSLGEDGCWTWGKKKVQEGKSQLFAKQNGNGKWRVFRRDYAAADGATTKVKNLWTDAAINHDNGRERVTDLMQANGVFDFPKAVELIQKTLMMGADKDSIVLDFFAGSATTADAVMQLNAEDGGNRRFIIVQLDEPVKAGTPAHDFCANTLQRPATIAEIAKERIRRAAAQIRADNPAARIDDGFRAFTVQDSAINQEAPQPLPDDKAQQSAFLTPLPPDQFQPLLFEALLHSGIMLSARIAEHSAGHYPFAIVERRVFCVTENLTAQVAEQIASQHGGDFDVFYYLSDCPTPDTSHATLTSAIQTAGSDKTLHILNFY